MILAAGRGERMRPLSDATPKPLLTVGGRPLIVWLIEALALAGITELVINVSHLGERIERTLVRGERWGVRITYSREVEALGTAGGIATALPLLGSTRFLVVNGDIHTDFDFRRMRVLSADAERLAHLVLVDNPPHHAVGDFALVGNHVVDKGEARYTFSGIGLYHPSLFAHIAPGTKHQLVSVLRPQIAAGRVSGERFGGRWHDVGTPERLAALDHSLAS